MEVTVGVMMLIAGILVSIPGIWLIQRFDKQANYSGIGNPYPSSGILYTIGILAVLSGGFFIIFGIAVTFI